MPEPIGVTSFLISNMGLIAYRALGTMISRNRERVMFVVGSNYANLSFH